MPFGVGGALGVLIAGTGVFGTAPAWAAAPTFDAPPSQTGYGAVTLTGTATPNASVTLREAAYKWGKDATSGSELSPATQYEDDMPTTVTANGSGRWTITRIMDSGFVWAVESGGEYSRVVKAALKVGATFTVTSSANNSVTFNVHTSPDQPYFPVRVERQSGGSWVEVAAGVTDGPAGEGGATPPNDDGDSNAEFQGTVTGQPGGQQTYRAVIAETGNAAYASAENLITSNTYTQNVNVGGTGGTTPPTTNPTTNPTTPPTTKPPTTPPSTTPVAGSVQFTRIQYNAAGVDKKTNSSVNGEYARLTNKTKKTINLKGWTVRDAAGNLYRFTTSYTLGAGKSVVVRTGKGTNSTATRYWGKTNHVWNNSGDTAYLRTAEGKSIDTCRWTTAGKGYTAC
ncbi:lamin tail domain-containing protein [Actinoplanes sp. NPDC023801]|uniref:lamin tail domain-containing protein n=1 Tax=Actinoplanes sp. NPDC023801 TaxID=3154595 RepID=UPI00340FB5C8